MKVKKIFLVIKFNGWLFEGYEDAKSVLMGRIVDEIISNRKFSERAIKYAAKHFEVFMEDFDAYYLGIRKWDIWELSIKWKSEIFTDPKMEVKSYFTHLICAKTSPVFQMDKS